MDLEKLSEKVAKKLPVLPDDTLEEIIIKLNKYALGDVHVCADYNGYILDNAKGDYYAQIEYQKLLNTDEKNLKLNQIIQI